LENQYDTGSSPVGDTMIKAGDIISHGFIAQNNESGRYIHNSLLEYPPTPGARVRDVWTHNFTNAKVLSTLEEWEKLLGDDFSVFNFAEIKLVVKFEFV
jgi:hypothetical protein